MRKELFNAYAEYSNALAKLAEATAVAREAEFRRECAAMVADNCRAELDAELKKEGAQ